MDNERDRQRLSEYRGELDEAEQRLGDLQAEVSALRTIVAGLEARVAGSDRDDAGENADTVRDPARAAIASLPVGIPRAMGNPHSSSLTEVVRVIMADGVSRSIGDVASELGRYGLAAETRRERQTLTNRLFDLAQKGYLTRVKRGLYQLASTDDTVENGVADETRTTSGESAMAAGSPSTQAATPSPGLHAA